MLRNVKELFKDSLVYGASSLLSQFASLFLVPFYTKELDPAEYGIFAMSAMLTGFIAPIGALGMDGALFRYYTLSDKQDEKLCYVSSASVLKMIGMILLLGIMACLFNYINSLLFEDKITSFQYSLILLTFFVESFSLLTIVVMRSERRVIRIARNNIITLSFAIVVSLWLVIIQKLKVDGVLLAGLITSLFKALLYLSDSLRLFSLRFVNTEAMKKLLSYGLPVIPHKLQAQTITLFTIFIINHKLGIVSAGMYAVAQKLAKPLSFIVGMVQQSWTPYKFEMHRTEQKPAIAFRNLISLYWILLLFLWGTLSLAIPFVFKLLINEKYWSGIPYVPFIMFLSVSQGIYFTLMTGFELSDRQYLMVKGSFWGMVSMLGVSLLTLNFYPPYSFILSQSLAFFVMAFVLFPEAKRMINIDYPFIPSFLLLLFTSGCIVLGYSNNSFLMKVGASIFLVFGFALASRFMLPPKIWNKAKTLILKNLQMPITSIK